MLKLYRLITAFFYLLLAWNVCGAVQTSLRDPGPGCTWKLHEFRDLGVRINYKSCDSSQSQWELRQKDDWIMQHRLGDDVIFGSHYLIRVFTKPADQSIEDAIREQVISKIEVNEWKSKLRNLKDQKLARKACEPIEVERHFRNTEAKIRLELYPKDGPYRRSIERDLRSFPRNFGCGAYGAGQGSRYFEYHPQASKTRFIFVEFGWDEDAMFEENSIELFEPRK